MQKSPGEQKHLYIRSRSFGQVADPMALSGVAACAPLPHLVLPWPAVCDGEGPTSVLALARPAGQDHMNLVPLLLA